MRWMILTSALLFAGHAAHAEKDPDRSSTDNRLATIAYNPNNIINLEAWALRSTLVQFALDETVELVALGDVMAWSYSKVRNLLFLKPKLLTSDPNYALRQHTNMQVVTIKETGEQRIYQFELIARSDADKEKEKPVYALTVGYPAEVAAAKRTAAQVKAEQQDDEKARARLEVEYYYGKRNWDYAGRGSREIRPTDVSDNGRSTVFRFPGHSPQPAIWKGRCDKQDEMANSKTHQGDLVEAQGIAPFWCLRLTDAIAYEVASVHFNPVGQPTGTGTTSSDVVRRVRHPAK